MMDATKDWKNLVDGNTWAKEICKSSPMTNRHTYTLDRKEVAHCHSCNKVTGTFVLHLTPINPKKPKTSHPTFIVHQEPLWPSTFTEYPPNPAYLDFTLEEILIYDPEARTRETETIYREGHKITISPLLFRNKYNHLPAYLVPMTPPLTLQPDCLQESVAANESTSTQIFGVMYITLTGLIDSMVSASGPWTLLGKLLSYIVKLAPILWWALPAGPAGCLPASSQEPPTGWIPDMHLHSLLNSSGLRQSRQKYWSSGATKYPRLAKL
ncbi:hypothetical protein DSO57_1018416 [Entomophthora muscae]|uniref:Uncharacterized protein n=1 Tax=Entomophthora muscae TaxID=34485 RepID=A0ACC2TFQ9_9FUNG|nr:hypothetical protein DSO57_1018416 [Entomophthora muscae]